ncbi:HTH_Tnp_Tc3_2 domain-containing protein [Trichonephila clavipes]|nr:HTH_Tnp_Tc3_2 domain-containing protein [Trichonephila clavipes]
MVVARCWQQWITEGRVYRRRGSGRPRNTNDREDRAIRRVATSAPTTSLASIQRHLPPSRHPVSSRETIRRRLTECRLDFCRPRATWSVTDWRRVIFSDESRFSLSADDHRTRVWRRTGQRSDPAFIVERHTAISQGVTVWGAISWDTRSSLVVLQGTLTARRYVDDILTPIVLPMLSSRPGAIYQQDNARPHTARLPNNVFKDMTSFARSNSSEMEIPVYKVPITLVNFIRNRFLLNSFLTDFYLTNEIGLPNFKPIETKLPVQLINATNEHYSMTRGHVASPLRIQGDIEDISSELDNGSVKGCTNWMKTQNSTTFRELGT